MTPNFDCTDAQVLIYELEALLAEAQFHKLEIHAYLEHNKDDVGVVQRCDAVLMWLASFADEVERALIDLEDVENYSPAANKGER